MIAGGIFGACAHDELPLVCQSARTGDIAISEIRGKQSGTDTWGEWLEFFNASSRELSLRGLDVRMSKLDGSDEQHLVVRSPHTLAPGSYFVFGRFSESDLPEHVDAGFLVDFDSDLYGEGVYDLLCGDADNLVDRVMLNGNLPSQGTLSFDGRLTPSAAANDEAQNWCPDASSASDGGSQLGLPGSPGRENRPCG
jgi:hypothetical protein